MRKIALVCFIGIFIALSTWILSPDSGVKKEQKKTSIINTDKKNSLEKTSTIQLPSNPKAPLKVKRETRHKSKTKLEQHRAYQRYQRYREKHYKMQQQRMRQYRAYQSKLKYMREGGAQSKLRAIKEKREKEFRQRYKSSMLSQKEAKQANLLRDNREIQKRREQMQLMQDKQKLQHKFKGE